MAATALASKDLVEQAVGRLGALATLPEITSQIIATVEDPKSSATQLHKIVSHDPVLVSRVLKVVNSAFYGLPGQVASVDRAIVLLGLNSVKNIALAASLGQLFRGARLCDGYSAKDLWKHCIGVAAIARELAKRERKALAEEAFLGGMVHDLGLLVSLQTWPEKLKQVCDASQKSDQRFVEIERDIIGVDHQQLGQALATRWKFPAECGHVAGRHHQPNGPSQQAAPLINTIAIADTLCCHAKQGFPLTAANQEITDSMVEVSAISRKTIDAVAADLPALVENASSMLG